MLSRILAKDTVVPTTQGNKVIPYVSMAINRLLQFTIAVIAIQFELVGFHEGIAFWLSYPVSKDVGSTTERWRDTFPRKPR